MSTFARRFHDETIHTPSSVRTSGHTLDWDIKPFQFKVYTEVPVLPLSREVDVLPRSTLQVLEADFGPAPRRRLDTLTALLYYSAGVTRKKTYPGGGEVLFRAAASTGALYQTELYVAGVEVAGLEPGCYHFCLGDFALRRLRDGDVRAALAASASDESIRHRAA